MKKEIADLWVAALRSGEYSQTKGCLRDETGYCCLGVLTALAIKNGLDLTETFRDDGSERYSYSDTGELDDISEVVLPSSVQIWAGMRSDNGEYDSDDVITSLAEANDCGVTFSAIANIIEENPDEL